MSTMAHQPRAVKPARDVCRLTIEIRGIAYTVQPLRPEDPDVLRAYRLRKADGTHYHVARTVWSPACDCPDFVFRREGLDALGCKHCRALVACGLIDNPALGEAGDDVQGARAAEVATC